MSAVPQVPEGIDLGPAQTIEAKDQHISSTHAATADNKHNNITTRPAWTIHDHAVDNARPIKVIVIGAGFSGILLGIRIPERIRNCELVIYEKNAGVVELTTSSNRHGNRYPGAACDIPSHSYQYSFNPKPDWPSVYSPASVIREYLESTAEKYGANRFIKLQHEVQACTWDQKHGKWHVQVQPADGTTFTDSCDILISARGVLNTKKWPTIPGLSTFQGEIMHSAAWNESYSFSHKRIGVIGSGSSAIQIIPQLQKIPGAKLNCFIRCKTWISPPFGEHAMSEMGYGNQLNFTPSQISHFQQSPSALLNLRLNFESGGNSIHGMVMKNSSMQKQMQELFSNDMKFGLASRPDIYSTLKPDFAPCCCRLTPGPGFLEALMEDNVSLINDDISHIEPRGVVTSDGTFHELDVLVCATGFYTNVAPPFPVRGINGRTLQEHWKDRAHAYLSIATNQFPNHFFMGGPNAGIGDGSLTIMIEASADYILKAIRKFQKEYLLSLSPSPSRERDFTSFCDAYFRGTVFLDNCNSWYRQNARGEPSDLVTGLWPGSSLHCIETLRSPRWEDFEYEYVPDINGNGAAEVNQLAWLGNGFVEAQLDDKATREMLAWYIVPVMQERKVGVPREGRPEENEQWRLRPWSY